MSDKVKIRRPNLGNWCLVKATAHKKIDVTNHQVSTKFMYADTSFEKGEIEPVKAMYIGMRVWSIGRINREWDGDYGSGFSYTRYKPKEYRQVWMFVASERRNSFYAYPEDVEIIE